MDIVSAQGRVPETHVLSKNELIASPWAHHKFGIEVGAPLYLLCQRRSIDGLDVLVEHINVSAKLCPGLFDHPLECLSDLFREQYGIRICRTQINMYPAPLNDA